MRRIVIINGWRITQVKQTDGSWWNIMVERVRSDGHPVPSFAVYG